MLSNLSEAAHYSVYSGKIQNLVLKFCRMADGSMRNRSLFEDYPGDFCRRQMARMHSAYWLVLIIRDAHIRCLTSPEIPRGVDECLRSIVYDYVMSRLLE